MEKLEAMRIGGKINRDVMSALFEAAVPGVALCELNDLAKKLIIGKGGFPAFKKVPGYSFAICANIGSGLIHGIPSEYRLKEGDVLTLDLGVEYAGYSTDHGWTGIISKLKSQNSKFEEGEHFLKAGEEALQQAIGQAVGGKHVGDIGAAIQDTIEGRGYFVVRDYTGHGVGAGLHEEPHLPCFGRRGEGPALYEGQTLAIEVMYTDRPSKLTIASDGWTIEALGANLAALFERTVVVGVKEAEVLT